MLLYSIILSIFLTIALIPILNRLAPGLKNLDLPDDRKVHLQAIPTTGGLAMALGFTVPVLLWPTWSDLVRSVLIGVWILVVLGFIDDRRGMGYKAKFAGQIAAALVVVLYGGIQIKTLGGLLPDHLLLPVWLSVPLTLVAIVGVTNAVNLADGLDGLAGGICLLGFSCIACLAYLKGDSVVALLSVAAAGSIIGFLRFNTYPATVFMGDTGSHFLGFLAATLSIGLTQRDATLSPLLPLIIVGVPVLDTLTVMLQRIIKGRSPFRADSNHMHHKLMRFGLEHPDAVVFVYILQAFLVASAFIFRFRSEWFLLVGYLIFSTAVLSVFLIADRAGWKIRRHEFLDLVFRGKLGRLRDKGVLIRISFRALKVGIPLLLLFSCFLPAGIPTDLSAASLLFGTGLFLLILFAKDKWIDRALRMVTYFLIPFVIYLSEKNTVTWMSDLSANMFDMFFWLLVAFLALTVMFTRRKRFQFSPLHLLLILFILLVAPNLHSEGLHGYNMAIMGAKIIVLLFGYEVLRSELRGKVRGLAVVTLSALAIVSLRGLFGNPQFFLTDPIYIALMGFSSFFVISQIIPKGGKLSGSGDDSAV